MARYSAGTLATAQGFLNLFAQAAMPAARSNDPEQQPDPWAALLGQEHGRPTRAGPER